jgi:four helix bundle protein
MKLEELNVYNLSMELGEKIWELIVNWDKFSKDTLGKQIVRSVDSIAANISEGFGRFHFNESNHFNYYARGSLYETKTWLIKAHNRNLIEKDSFENLLNTINVLGIKLNNYINSIGKAANNHK